MNYVANPTGKGWPETLSLLADVFAKWRVKDWSWHCPAANTFGGGRGRNHWSVISAPSATAQVTVTFVHPKDGERSITVSKFAYPVDNLWAIWKGLDAIRLNEIRGLDDVERQFYQALPSPVVKRDPWEVLDLRPGADADTIRDMYRLKAKRMHPDTGGDPDAFKELTEARDALLSQAVRS